MEHRYHITSTDSPERKFRKLNNYRPDLYSIIRENNFFERLRIIYAIKKNPESKKKKQIILLRCF